MLLLITHWLSTRLALDADDGFSTAELLGNAALALAVIVAIWGGMSEMGAEFIDKMKVQLGL